MQASVTLRRMRMLVAALWAWLAIGVSVAAITLSSVLSDRVAFGETVSILFRVEAWVGLACGLALLLLLWRDDQLDARKRRTQIILVAVMLLCVLGYFGLQPIMGALREGAGPGGVMASSARRQFGMLHGASMLLYLVHTVLALVLLFKNRK